MSFVPAYAYLSLVLAISMWYLISRRTNRRGRSMRCMPGPRQPHLLTGNLSQITRPHRDTHRQLTQWANECGGLYLIRVLAKPIVICTDPVLAQRVLGVSKNSFPKAAFAYDGAIDLSSINSHRNLFTYLDESKHWQNVRKAIAPAFSSKAIKSYFPIIRSKGEQLSHTILKLAEKSEDGTAKVEIHAAVLRASFDIIGQAGLRLDWDTLADLISSKHGSSEMPKEANNDNVAVGLSALRAVDGVLEEFSLRMADILRVHFQKLFPFLKHSTEVQGKVTAAQDAYRSILGLMRKQGSPDSEGISIGEALLRLKDPDSPDQALSDDRLMSELAPMLIGGYETSATAIQWVLYDIANNPEVQTKLKLELKSSGLLTLPALTGGRPLEMDDLTLPYFNAVVKESMRLHSITGSTATVRQAPEDLEFGGYFLPKGTAIWVPLYSMANSAHNFERPSSFWPERWQDQEATSLSKGPPLGAGHPTPAGNSALPARSNLPFSQGPRDCIGQNLGNVVVRTLVLAVLRRFWLAVDMERMGSPEEVEANQVMALTVQHPRGFHFLCSEHS